MRDFSAAPPIATTADVSLTLERLAIDADGLDRRCLQTLTARPGSGPAGFETQAAATGEPADTLQDTVEPYLIEQGFIERTAQGRIANGAAWARFPDLASSRPTDQPTLTGPESSNRVGKAQNRGTRSLMPACPRRSIAAVAAPTARP